MKCLAALVWLVLLSALLPPVCRADQTPLVTGNGFGFAVFSLKEGRLSKFFAHPYMFEGPDPADSLSEGMATANYIKALSFELPSSLPAAALSRAAKASGQKPASISGLAKCQSGYLNESQIISSDNGRYCQYFYMPFALEADVLITAAVSKDNRPLNLSIQWEHPVISDSIEKIDSRQMRIMQFDGVKETLGLLALSGQASVAYSQRKSACFFGGSQWALISGADRLQVKEIAERVIAWQHNLDGEALIRREQKEVEAWRVVPAVKFQSASERKLWRQSEIVLRMGQIREVDNSKRHNQGLIIASLPDGPCAVPWVRDMAYATMALSRMGHRAEAHQALMSYFNARPVGKMEKEVGAPYQISVCRYFGDGSEEPFFTMEGSNNVELDDFGLVLWVLGDYCRTYKDQQILNKTTYRGSVYESARDFVVRPLISCLEPYQDGLIVKADTSIWEERQKDKKHFAFSTIAAINGLKSFLNIMEQMPALSANDSALRNELKTKLPLLEKGFMCAYLPDGKLRGALEEGIKNQVDGAMLSAITTGIINSPDIMKRALDSMQSLRVPSGGYKRVTCILEDPQIFEYWYERQEFIFIDLLVAQIHRRLHEFDKANSLSACIVEKAARDHFFIPEMYVSQVNYRFVGPLGTPTGAIPMVGYGAGVYILYSLDSKF